jgi:hypothetical protein
MPDLHKQIELKELKWLFFLWKVESEKSKVESRKSKVKVESRKAKDEYLWQR